MKTTPAKKSAIKPAAKKAAKKAASKTSAKPAAKKAAKKNAATTPGTPSKPAVDARFTTIVDAVLSGKIKLTALERKAVALAIKSMEGNGFDMGYASDIKLGGKKAADAAVIGSLIKKGVLGWESEKGIIWFGDSNNNLDSAERLLSALTKVDVEPETPAPEPAPVATPAPAASKTSADSRYHNPVRSVVESPVSIMRNLCEKHYPKKTRKQIIQMGIDKGVSPNTSMTQFAMWKARKIKEGTLPTA